MTLLSVEEAAVLARCGKKAIYAAIKNNEIEVLRSTRWLVDEGALVEWMRQRASEGRSSPKVVRRVRRPAKPRGDRVGSVHQLRAMQQGGGTG